MGEESSSPRPNGSGSNSKSDATLTAVRDFISGNSTSLASARLSEALNKLHDVDIILEQLSAFWTNTEVVLDRLTKKGQHVEQFMAFCRSQSFWPGSRRGWKNTDAF